MIAPAIPKNEKERIEQLRSLGILDTAAEERFDRVTRMAKRLFDVPIVAISLTDTNRQWFKSCLGLSLTESDRDTSFCGHAILGDGLFLIEDAQQDERFSNNPSVIGHPFIRFYAGQPLKISAGLNLGTLCLIDTRPRTLSGEDQIMLKDLAAMIESELNALHLATIDSLTQLANRRGLYAIGDQVLRISARLKFTPMLVCFDLDGFKQINDTLGHDQGDQALMDFASLLSTNFRESDVIARIGGDEFAVHFANTDGQESQLIEQRLRDYVDAFNRNYQRAYKIEFSMGIVTQSADHHGSVESMLKQADALMYRQKLARRN